MPGARQEQGLSLVPASPFQRLAAALLDLLILIVVDAVLVVLCTAIFSTESAGAAAVWAATPVSLVYLLAFWAWGQTPGKWVFSARIAGPEGGRPGLARAALRIVGYVAASLPFKIGLLAMLWDERGRGWHDRIAGTMVVRTGAQAGAAPPPDSAAPEAVEGARWGLCRQDVAILGVFALATVALTWPAFAHLPRRFPSNGGDADLFIWDLWWSKKALLEPGLQMFRTDYLFWPNAISVRLHSFSLFNCALGIPLQAFLSPVMAYSALAFLAFTLTAWAAYLLGRCVSGSRAAGLLAGLIFGFSPYMIWHGFGHLNLISSEFAVAYVLLLVMLLRGGRARHALAAGAALALAGLCNWYHLVHLTLFTAVFAPAWLLVRREGALRRLVALGAAVALAFALLTPWIAPMAREFGSGRFRSETQWARARAQSVSLDVCSLITPPPYHPVFGRWTRAVYERTLARQSSVEQAGYLGWTALALAAVALWDRRRRRANMPWAAGGVVCVLLALGLSIHICGAPGLPLWMRLLAGGPPGSGTDLPVVPSDAVAAAWALVTGSPQKFASVRQVEMPLAWLWNAASVTRLGSVPARFVQVAYLCLAVLAACGAVQVAERARRRWGKWGGRAAVAALCALVAFEYLAAPRFPTEEAAVHPFYRRLARESGCAAVLEVPVWRVWHPVFQRAQTVHGKRLYRGFVARIPDGAESFVRKHPLLSEALAQVLARRRSRRVALGIGREPAWEPEQMARYRADVRALAATGCCYILLHKDVIERRSLREAERLLGGALRLPVAFDDRLLRAYRVQASGPGGRAGELGEQATLRR